MAEHDLLHITHIDLNTTIGIVDGGLPAMSSADYQEWDVASVGVFHLVKCKLGFGFIDQQHGS